MFTVPSLTAVIDSRAILPQGAKIVALLPAEYEENVDGQEAVYGTIESHRTRNGLVTYFTKEGAIVPSEFVAGYSFGATIPDDVKRSMLGMPPAIYA